MPPDDTGAVGSGSSWRPWIVCQLGAREHYVIARGLHDAGRLGAVVTDIWVAPSHGAMRVLGRIGRRARDRHAPGLTDARVEHFAADTLYFELKQRLRGIDPKSWPAIMARNRWFQDRVIARFQQRNLLREKPVVFAYSYAALDILCCAKAAGCVTVLGQIDPGIVEENIVCDAVARHAALSPIWSRAPARYWDLWREECAVADHIVVNSTWSRDGLIEAGVDRNKVSIVPLAYDGGTQPPRPAQPTRFDAARPLRVLFLGSLVVRKGIAELLDAARLLADAPVEFHLVGSEGIVFPPDLIGNRRIIRHGHATRGNVAMHYAAADVFVLPTLSDGFALTQIEAQAHGLPVIASRFCGDVVRDGVDGFLLDATTGTAIADTILRYLRAPELVAAQGQAALSGIDRFAPSRITQKLLAVAPERLA